MKSFKEVRSYIKDDYAQDLDLAQKNMARLAKKETGQDKKDYMAVARALNQGNLGAVKKVIKGISTDEIRADILNILVGYNDLIAKMYPKAVDSKGRLKSGMSVSKMIKEDTVEEATLAQLKRKHKRHIDNFNKRNKDLPSNVEKDLMKYAMDNDGIGDDPDDFDDWLVQNIEEALGNDNPSHREKPKMDKDGTVHNIPGKKAGSAYNIKPRLDGKVLKFGTVDNFGNIKVMTVQELAKVVK